MQQPDYQQPGPQHAKTPHVLVIMDGIGHREDTQDNAFLSAHTPHLTAIKSRHAHGLISGSGEDVGLPEGQFGNSEVGHMNLGAGRVLYQDSTRIHKAIREGEFFENAVLTDAIGRAISQGGAVHIMGLLSDGGVHSHQDHLVAAVRLALQQGTQRVYVHAFLDGRDTPPRSADRYVTEFENALKQLNTEFSGHAALASVIGRYFAMDRDKRWDRVQQAYDLLTQGKAERVVATGVAAIEAAYQADESDEFVKATRIVTAGQSAQEGVIADHDCVIFMNFRADRAREISQAFVLPEFDGFVRQRVPQLSAFVMLTHYSDELAAQSLTTTAYVPTTLSNTLGEYLANLGKTQLRIAETEKYAHVTFFFSGGREAEFDGEQRILIPSPNVATYDLQPEMSAIEVTDQLVQAIQSGQFDVLVVNYANGDMVGHTGVFDAAVRAVETVDACIGRLYDAVMAAKGHLLITADHGNVEQMQDYDSGQVHTQHTTELVPFIYAGPHTVSISDGGVLADVAPTLLNLMQLPVPAEMTGRNLIQPVSA